MNTISCKNIGVLKQDERFEDWWESNPIKIPFFNQTELKVIFRDFILEHDATFISEAERAFENFLIKEEKNRLSITDEVYRNFQEFVEEVGLEYLGDEIQNIKTKEEIWNFVYPSDIYITRRHRRDQDIYLEVTCECDWEPEHGLQLVFRKGKTLTRVSGQDGHITDADAHDIPDSEDKLLSQFKD